MTLVELNSVTTRRARQEPPPAPHIFFLKGGITFLPNFDSSITRLFCLGNVQKILVPETTFKYICVVVEGGTEEKVRRISENGSEISSLKLYRLIFFLSPLFIPSV